MPDFTAEELEAGRLLFAGEVAFVKGVVALDGLPPADRPEVAFAGRSNVGKSSLINALCNRKTLARASNTPGRTQELNFFNVARGRLYLVDLPGYGFADAPKKMVDTWNRLMLGYLRGRNTLKRVFVLIDARRGVGEVDSGFLDQLDGAAVSYQVILTKTDKLKASELAPLLADTQAALKRRPAAHPVILPSSSETGAGLPDIRCHIAALAL